MSVCVRVVPGSGASKPTLATGCHRSGSVKLTKISKALQCRKLRPQSKHCAVKGSSKNAEMKSGRSEILGRRPHRSLHSGRVLRKSAKTQKRRALKGQQSDQSAGGHKQTRANP